MTEFKVGDVVRLKSGGPSMTVVGFQKTHPSMASCVWFLSGEELYKEFFTVESLMYASAGD